MTEIVRHSLAEEVQYIHSSLFDGLLDPIVIERYEAANHLCFGILDEAQSRLVDIVLSQRLDLEAVELTLRLRRRDNLLTKKIQILFYLLEVRSDYLDQFVNRENRHRAAIARLIGSALRTGWKLAKGHYLVRRYALI